MPPGGLDFSVALGAIASPQVETTMGAEVGHPADGETFSAAAAPRRRSRRCNLRGLLALPRGILSPHGGGWWGKGLVGIRPRAGCLERSQIQHQQRLFVLLQ